MKSGLAGNPNAESTISLESFPIPWYTIANPFIRLLGEKATFSRVLEFSFFNNSKVNFVFSRETMLLFLFCR